MVRNRHVLSETLKRELLSGFSKTREQMRSLAGITDGAGETIGYLKRDSLGNHSEIRKLKRAVEAIDAEREREEREKQNGK